jgi:hypothetical protein
MSPRGVRSLTLAITSMFALSAYRSVFTPTPWILLVRSPGMTVYIDSTRVERGRPDTSVGVWLRFVYDSAIRPRDDVKTGPLLKAFEIHSGIRCWQNRVRELEVIAYTPTGKEAGRDTLVSHRSVWNKWVENVIGPTCGWIRDPATPPDVSAGESSLQRFIHWAFDGWGVPFLFAVALAVWQVIVRLPKVHRPITSASPGGTEDPVAPLSSRARSSVADEREMEAYAEIGPTLTQLERHLAEWRHWNEAAPDSVQAAFVSTSREAVTVAWKRYATITSERTTVLPKEVSERLDNVLEKVRWEIYERTDPSALRATDSPMQIHKAQLGAIAAINGARQAMQARVTQLRARD